MQACRKDTFYAVAHPLAGPAEAGELDPASRRCLFCHDGASGPSGDFSLPSGTAARGLGRSHPIGVPYPSRPKLQRDNAYVPRSRLDPRVVLHEGRMGCLSCHDVFGREEKLLAIPNEGSRLCYACHEI